jgi:hypothetical protein
MGDDGPSPAKFSVRGGLPNCVAVRACLIFAFDILSRNLADEIVEMAKNNPKSVFSSAKPQQAATTGNHSAGKKLRMNRPGLPPQKRS